MSSNGWIKLHRKSIESAVFQDADLWRFWCWCLFRATHKPRQDISFAYVELQPGQFVTGRRSASEALGVTERCIRTCVKRLCNLGNIDVKVTSKFSVITVVNWALYQEFDEEVTSKWPASDQQVASKWPASDHKQECKELKKERMKEYNKEYIVHPTDICPPESVDEEPCRDLVELSKDPGQLPGGLIKPSGCRLPMQQIRVQAELFLVWYQAYPRKVGRKPAWEKWLRIKPLPTNEDLSRMLEVLDHQSRSDQWQESIKLIPMPETYISKQRWDEDISAPDPKYGYAGDW